MTNDAAFQNCATPPVHTGGICRWFAMCDHPAAGTVHHPILGDVPTCERCATKFGLDLTTVTP